jgi:hypothetical protein
MDGIKSNLPGQKILVEMAHIHFLLDSILKIINLAILETSPVLIIPIPE